MVFASRLFKLPYIYSMRNIAIIIETVAYIDALEQVPSLHKYDAHV